MASYREPGKRKKIPRKLRSWFISNADGTEKGPFEYESLIASGKSDRLKPSTLVRPEDEPAFRPLSDLLAEELIREAAKKGAAADVATAALRQGDAEPGSFGMGFVAGFVGGLIGWGLVAVFAHGNETKRGAKWGMVLQLTLGIVRFFMMTLPDRH